MDLSKIDKNFKGSEGLQNLDLQFVDVKELSGLYGVYYDEAYGGYLRMPLEVAKACDEHNRAEVDCLQYLVRNTAGGRLRFSTNSRYVAIKGIEEVGYMNHMPLTGSGGFVLYQDGEQGSKYYANLMFVSCDDGTFDAFVDTGNREWKSFTMYFPLYSSVYALSLGYDKDAEIGAGKKYAQKGRIIYYGSSITQGGCASRAGNSYQGRIERKIDMDYLNLGFSGNAKGELAMAEYIASLSAEIFVCDYDYNAEDAAYLRATHLPFVETYRKKNPTTPVILVSRPSATLDEDTVERREVILDTYRAMQTRGDKNIYFVDGYALFEGEQREDCTVDGCHPNDLGFYRMSVGIGGQIERILKEKK